MVNDFNSVRYHELRNINTVVLYYCTVPPSPSITCCFHRHPDKEFDGDLWTREGLRIKYLAQEPDLDSSLNVMDNIRRGIAEQVLTSYSTRKSLKDGRLPPPTTTNSNMLDPTYVRTTSGCTTTCRTVYDTMIPAC